MSTTSREYPKFKRNFVGPLLTRKQRIALSAPMPASINDVYEFYTKPEPKVAAIRKNYEAKGRKLYKDMSPEQRAKHVARVNARQEKIKQATPSWSNHDIILAYYIVCQNMTKITGVKHEVDHIIPIQHPLVCGLHVENNIQIITEQENIKKSNNFEII